MNMNYLYLHRGFNFVVAATILASVTCAVADSPAGNDSTANSQVPNITNVVNSAYAKDPSGWTDVRQIPCETHDDCGSPCKCTPFVVSFDCVNFEVYESELSNCAKCSFNDDCVEDGLCSAYGFCGDCEVEAAFSAVDVCEAASPVIEATPEATTTVPISDPPRNPEDEEITAVAQCVETEWLENNGFSDGILRRSAVSKTLCMKGLPCGTEGHLLRLCGPDGECRLVSFREICEKRGDCTVKYTEVSRISHTVDWSVVKVTHDEVDGGSVCLTSLSADVEGEFVWLSNVIARAGEKLIAAGYGHVVNGAVLVVSDASRLVRFFVSELAETCSKLN